MSPMNNALAALLLSVGSFGPALAAVAVVEGPTPIPGGAASSAGDITLMNDRLAVALAVQSQVPYGVPRGAIVDIAPVSGGKIGRDRVAFADFIPNNWLAWPNTYQHMEILERGPAQVVVRVVRDWGQVTVTTLYTLRDHADHLDLLSTMSNGSDQPLTNLLSGFTLWSSSGFLLGVPGMPLVNADTAGVALAERVVAYDSDWSITLHAPSIDYVSNGSRDLLHRHVLAPGASRNFEAELQVGDSGDLNPVLRSEQERRHRATGRVRGQVSDHTGAPVEQPVIVIRRNAQVYGWVNGHHGHYDLSLPAGEYSLSATAQGMSQSMPAMVTVVAGAAATQDFRGLDGGGHIHFKVSAARGGEPLDARISIVDGQRPEVGYLGATTFFTALAAPGQADVTVAAGSYVFKVSAGGGFIGAAKQVPVRLKAGATQTVAVALQPEFSPQARGWYSADLHNHADQAEAVTPPEFLVRSQLAAGLDLLSASDHDSTVNFGALQRMARQRGRPFMGNIEISTSWAHFNAFPLALDAKFQLDTSKASINDVIREARRMGATVLQANHPFNSYGYFTSLAAGMAPGGFEPVFDLLEINASGTADENRKTLQLLWDYWNAGHRIYLGAGTDIHDVWRNESGALRIYAHVDGRLSAAGFAQSLKDGHAYVTSGPLLYPAVRFGDSLRVKPGATFVLSFDLQSVAGIAKAELIGDGKVVKAQSFDASASHALHVEFPLSADTVRWYALQVYDQQGGVAYSNPIWIDSIDYP